MISHLLIPLMFSSSRPGFYLPNSLKKIVGCMRQVLGPGALGRPRGIRWRGRWGGVDQDGEHI